MSSSLREAWDVRNAAATTLIKTEEQLRRLLETSSAEDIVALLETFSPARSPGPEWTRSWDPLVERLWTWCDPEVLSQVEAEFRNRGQPWAAIANALAPGNGEQVRQRLNRSAPIARLPAFSLGS